MALNKLQNKLLDNFKILKKLFDDNNIKYALAAGSAIGAIRENGFIPWDDDMDLIIPEEDVEKFVKAIAKSKNMSLENYKNRSLNSFYKVYFEDFVMNGKRKSFIKIDVFTIYKERKFTFFQNLRRVVFIGLIDFKSYAPTRYFANLIVPVTKKWLRKKAKKAILDGEIVKSELGYAYDDRNYWHANKAANYFYNKYSIVKFEGLNVPVPFKARETMMDIYGDILKSPSKENQVIHGTKLL